MKITPNEECIYEGEYILHWEVAGLRIKSGKKLLGLIDIWERWLVTFPENYIWPDDSIDPKKLISPEGGGKYRLVAKGIVSEKGHLGHLGCYNREFIISEVIELKKIK